MFLKKLLLFIGFISIIHAQPLNNENVHFTIQERGGNSYILFNSSIEGKTWIGIYKKDTSNEWENVQKWEWATKPTTKISISSLATGDYEARLFFNNSFITEKVISFHMEAGPAQLGNRLKDTTIKISDSRFFQLQDVLYDEDEPLNWVGVFKFGSKHNRDNLLAWGYVEKDNRVTIKTISGKNLSPDNYDLVYFENNSYNHQVGDTETLTVKYAYIIHGDFQERYERKDVLKIYKYNSFKKENDWVAIFKEDAKPIKENILHWAYVKDGRVMMNEDEVYTVAYYFPTFPPMLHGYYKIVLFENDSYKILGTSILHAGSEH